MRLFRTDAPREIKRRLNPDTEAGNPEGDNTVRLL